MKQLLFLLLFPCLCVAQYTGNAGQKITLGEQTTADGLVFRGVENDTALITPLSDTSAYIILDTVNNRFYNYNRATNVWSLAGGGVSVSSFSAGTTGLTPSTATTGAVTLGGTLAVANGGTNRTTMPAGYILHGDGTSVDTAVGLFWDRSLRFLGVGTSSPASDININSSSSTPTMAFSQSFSNTSAQRGGFAFYNSGISTVAAIIAQAVTDNVGTDLEFYTRPVGGSLTKNMVISNNGNVGIGTASPQMGLHLVKNHTSGKSTFYIQSVTSYASDGLSSFGFADSDGSRKAFFYTDKNALSLETNTTNPIIFLPNGTETMRIRTNSEVGIGYGATDNGAFPLQVNGSIYAAGTTYPSDERYKENIIPLNKGLDLINKLKPVTFNYINTTENNFSEFEEIGFIAQDVDRALSTETFVKSIVKYSDESNTDSKMVFSPQNLIPILTKAIQEQQALIKALEQRIINLENK